MSSSEYYAKIVWRREEGEIYTDRKYNRCHEWQFDGGIVVPASPSPHVVPAPMSSESNVDPEEAFVASLSSCHMLFFLDLASKKRFVVDEYVDDAVGILEKNQEGRVAMTKVTLRPSTHFSGEKIPSKEQINQIHHQAHEYCYIANSVKTEIVIEVPTNP